MSSQSVLSFELAFFTLKLSFSLNDLQNIKIQKLTKKIKK